MFLRFRSVAYISLFVAALSNCQPSSRLPVVQKELSSLDSEAQRTEVARRRINLPAEAFGAEEWGQYYGDVGVAPALPGNISEILDSVCPFWPDRCVRDTHLLTLIPATVNGRPFTLDLLRELIQAPRGGGHATRYRRYRDYLQEQYGAKAPASSYWVLMTRDALPDSRYKTYETQQSLVGRHVYQGYGLPTVLEAATSVLLHHVRSGERLYSDNPWTYSRCHASELINGQWSIAVGGFESAGLDVSDVYGSHMAYYFGVAGCRKF